MDKISLPLLSVCNALQVSRHYQILSFVWTYSIFLDASACRGTSYVDFEFNLSGNASCPTCKSYPSRPLACNRFLSVLDALKAARLPHFLLEAAPNRFILVRSAEHDRRNIWYHYFPAVGSFWRHQCRVVSASPALHSASSAVSVM